MDIKQEILKDFINLKRYIKPVSVGQYNDKGVNIGYKQAEDVIEDFLSQAIDLAIEEGKREIIKKVDEEIIGKDETWGGYNGEKIVDDKEIYGRNNLRFEQRDKLKALSPNK